MTPQGVLRARFSELAEAMGVALSVRRQTGKFYFTVTGTWEGTSRFMHGTFPGAWITSAAGPESVYGLPIAEVERVLSEVRIEPAWLQRHDAAPLKIARHIREQGAFEGLVALFPQSFHIVRMAKPNAKVFFLHLLQRDTVVIQHRLIH